MLDWQDAVCTVQEVLRELTVSWLAADKLSKSWEVDDGTVGVMDKVVSSTGFNIFQSLPGC